ncbi:MAG: winged helix-turn-helix domain-containing protein [Pyrinomonadaceae bacterium]
MLDKIWADSFVEESNLSRHIYLLRKTLKEYGADKNLIENVPRRGYRFTGELRGASNGEVIIEKHTLTQTSIEFEEGGGEEFEQKEKRRKKVKKRLFSFSAVAAVVFVLIGGAAFFSYQKRQSGASVPEIRSIAVLPFKTINPDGQNDHRGLGLADVLITRLSNIREISVRPTGAIVNFDHQESDSVSFGRKLNVDAVLEGTIYQSKENIIPGCVNKQDCFCRG